MYSDKSLGFTQYGDQSDPTTDGDLIQAWYTVQYIWYTYRSTCIGYR